MHSEDDLVTLLRVADGGTSRQLARDIGRRAGNAGLVRLVAGRTSGGRSGEAHRRRAATSLFDAAADEVRSFFGIEPDELDEELSDDEATAAPTTSGTTISVVDSPYTVSGNFTAVANQIAARTEAGSVTSEFTDIHYFPIPGPIRLANITVTETVSLPNWSDRPQASEAEKREWDRFRGALAAHERGHVALDRAAFTDIHRRCIGVLDTVADARIDAAIAASNTANAEFDTNTDHGRNAGTRIDGSVAAARPEP